MTDQPGSTPVGNPPAATQPPAPAPAPAGNPPPAAPTADEGYVKVPLKEWQQTERDAARHRSRKPVAAKPDRYAQPPANPEDDPEKADLLNQITQKDRENMQLKLNNKVRDLLETDEYKALPDTAKRLLKKNPMAFVDNRAKSLDDAVADIQDWLDEEISLATVTPPVTTPPPETPPVPGAGPTPVKGSPEESTEGKTGPARSTTVLKNLFKQKGVK